jgi:hypothetical protein
MGRPKIVYDEVIVGLDQLTLELARRLSQEETTPLATLLRRIIRTYLLAEAERRGWLREREEAAAPQLLTS